MENKMISKDKNQMWKYIYRQKQINQIVLPIDNITTKRKMLNNYWTQYSNHAFLQEYSLKL